MARCRLTAIITMFLFVISLVCLTNPVFSNELVDEENVELLLTSNELQDVSAVSQTEGDYVGPGKHETELYIRETPRGDDDSLVEVGKVAMWNTREQFLIRIEPEEDWQISEVRIFVGSEPVPMADGGTPKTGTFPYKENFIKPVSSYELALDLVDDLNFTWGRRSQGDRIHNVAVFVRLRGEGEQGNGQQVRNEEAWAKGEKQFESKWGWWSRYAMDHPQTGHFIDAPVCGADYETTFKGRTNANGAFEYIEGENVTLSISSLLLGTATAQHKISPLDLVGTNDLGDPRVINMARLLQSLDVDGEPVKGINITEQVVEYLEQAMGVLGISGQDFDFGNNDLVSQLIAKTVAIANAEDVNLVEVSAIEALENLEKGTSGGEMFRKNVSKNPEMEVAKAKLELMPVNVPARKANGDPVKLVYKDSDGNVIVDDEGNNVEHLTAKPLVATYAEEIPGTGAKDVFAAVSRDGGETWKRTNLSRSAARSSFTLANGTEYPGDILKPNIKVSDNKILVVWTSYYARSGQPTYSISKNDESVSDDVYYEEDIWGVGGPQRSFDYTEMGFPEVGELPFHCVWTCRGIIDKDTGEITWFKPERLTSGRRGAYQIMVNAAKNAGFALVWQEDPEGIRPGEQAGPGEGWSGATTNHKTDIWYSYVKWDDFGKKEFVKQERQNDDNKQKTMWQSQNNIQREDEDEDKDKGEMKRSQNIQHDDDQGTLQNQKNKEEDEDDEDEEIDGRPKALVPFSLPVRISDNDMLNAENMKLIKDPERSGIWTLDPDADKLGSHRYGLELIGYDSVTKSVYEHSCNKLICGLKRKEYLLYTG